MPYVPTARPCAGGPSLAMRERSSDRPALASRSLLKASISYPSAVAAITPVPCGPTARQSAGGLGSRNRIRRSVVRPLESLPKQGHLLTHRSASTTRKSVRHVCRARLIDFQPESQNECSAVCTFAKVCTDTESSVVGSLSTFHRVSLNSMEGGGWSSFAAPLPDAHPRLAGPLLLCP